MVKVNEELLVDAIIQVHHIEIDHLVGGDIQVLAQQRVVDSLLNELIVDAGDVSKEIDNLMIRVSNAAFRAGVAYGVRFAQEMDSLTRRGERESI